MSEHKNIENELRKLQQVTDKETAIDHKLDELVNLLAHSHIDSEKVKQLKQRVNQALDSATPNSTDPLKALQQADIDEGADRAQLLDEFSVLLANHPVDSKMAKKYLRVERLSRFFLILIGIVLVTLGFAMIIMPAPPYFEMFTIFYFNPNDGVTLMDIISLLIILSGIYLLVKSVYKTLSTEQ